MKLNALEETLKEFMGISQIPRPSHHEERIGQYLVAWAKEHGLAVEQDEIGDVIIDKPASPGHADAPRVIVQAHMDMVCVVAGGIDHDPLNDPIKVINDGKVLKAVGTSLGADDGIGVALGLYLLKDDSLIHGPLRAIFTVNEEDGMSSIAMPMKYLDADYLINLDWEWLGSLCYSACGGNSFDFSHKAQWVSTESTDCGIKVGFNGLLGGHCSVDINLNRANALVFLATALCRLREAGIPFHIADFHGGQARNAIPSQSEAIIAVPQGRVNDAKAVFACYEKSFAKDFSSIETNYEFVVRDVPVPAKVLTDAIGNALLTLLTTLPCKVNTMSSSVITLTESSQNLGTLTVTDTEILLKGKNHCLVPYRSQELLRTSRLIAGLVGFEFKMRAHYPAWVGNPSSKLIGQACDVYKEITDIDMVVEPIHGGLECCAFFDKNPNLDMIAIGPSLSNVHSPDETCDIESVRVTAELLIKLLERLV